MSSTNSSTCAFCTFINEPDATICIICKKSLHLPAVSRSNISKVKVCTACFYHNAAINIGCEVCGTSLRKVHIVEVKFCSSCTHQNTTSAEMCVMCYRKLVKEEATAIGPEPRLCSMCGNCINTKINASEKSGVKICKTCTYQNEANSVECLMCMTPYDDTTDQEVLANVCPFCNHDNVPGMICHLCTFENSPGCIYCVMCEEPLLDLVEDDANTTEEDADTAMEDADATEEDVVTTSPTTLPTVDANIVKNEISPDSFEMLDIAPETHNYFHTTLKNRTGTFLRAVSSNIEILKTSLPPGVWIKAYEDRMDLLSVMIEGPHKTPYENGLFLFHIHLPAQFPKQPPKVHYISFWHHRLNPNLYTEGKVCVSLLGTWPSQRPEEKWGPKSTLLQVIVSIQGLILVEEPYFNEPGTGHSGTAAEKPHSDRYNEDVIKGMVVSTATLITNAPVEFKKEITEHFSKFGQAIYLRLKAFKRPMRTADRANLESLRIAIENISKI